MKKLRDYVFLGIMILVIIFGVVSICLHAQEKPDPPAEAQEPAPPKTWKVPDYMRENLQRDIEDFNKRFEAKVQAYKKELKTRFSEFKDMPEDVILYLEGGFFITRSDYLKLQEQLRDRLKQEVKGDDKTIN